MSSARTLAALWSARAAASASRALGRGGGTAVSGLVALTLQPAFVRELAAGLGRGCVLITGTNGKTTTSRLVSAAVKAAGLEPLANASGSNLMRGIASTLAAPARTRGALAGGARRIGVFEVDEATLPLALAQLSPRAVVILNLFRDQLDRYGEVEAVAALWREALASYEDLQDESRGCAKTGPHAQPAALRLVLNADDPAVASLGEGRDGVVYFGIEDGSLGRDRLEHASDALTCRCGERLDYDVAYFAHLGHWHCRACWRSRPVPQVKATEVELRDGRSLSFQLSSLAKGGASPAHADEPETLGVEIGIGGLYNVYNALAAVAAALVLGLPIEAIEPALATAPAAFGRQESFDVGGRRVEVVLGKNPAGLNQVLATLMLDSSRRAALVILNDGIADGRDISWIWDADFEVAANQFATVVVSGSRAEELALRLKYAEWPEASLQIEPKIARALDRALAATPAGETLTVVPTYTAMLEVRELLAKQAGRAPFWQQASATAGGR